jgi:multiple sugar transport system permease protein
VNGTIRGEFTTLQLALAEFREQFNNNWPLIWPLMMAAVTITTVPVMVLFLIGQKQFIRGIAPTRI